MVPKPWKMVIIIPQRRRGTWKGVPVATWCNDWIYRMWGGLVHHIIIIPAALSLQLLRGAAVGCAPTIFQNDWFCNRINNFSKSPIFSMARGTKIWKITFKNRVRFVVREIDCGNWLARGYMPAHQHCDLFYPLVGDLLGSALNYVMFRYSGPGQVLGS